jgi:Na+/pantothenate symporter
MNWLIEHWLVLLLFIVYTIMIAHHALIGKRRTRGMLDYYVGGRTLGGLALGISFFAAILLFAGTVQSAGGITAFWEIQNLPEKSHLFSWDAAMPFPVLIGIIVAGTMKFIVEPRQLSRFYALADQRAIRTGTWVSTGMFLIVYALLVPIGIYAHKIVPGNITDTDLVVPTLMSGGDVFNPAIGAFLFVAMVAAAMSSLDSVLLVMASTCHRDLVSVWRLHISDLSAVRATRIYVAIFAFITALIALNPPGGIVALTAFSGSLYAACFFPVIVFGLYWHRGNGKAAIASFVTGIATLLLWKYLPFAASVHSVFPAMLLSTLGYISFSYWGAHNTVLDFAKLFPVAEKQFSEASP